MLLKTTPITVNIAYEICQLDTSKNFHESIILITLVCAKRFLTLIVGMFSLFLTFD